MSALCQWLHTQLSQLPLITHPLDLEQIPPKGIYFFYEEGETWEHGGEQPRIVRVGTHHKKNLRKRLDEHYLIGKYAKRLNFADTQPVKPAPKERSIFRKHLGRALLNKSHDPYLDVWNFKLSNPATRPQYESLRDPQKEREIEGAISKLLQTKFSLRCLLVEDEKQRFELEANLIGTLVQCSDCKPSTNWLGNYSPKAGTRRSGLWLVQELDKPAINSQQQQLIDKALINTVSWQNLKQPGN